MRSFVKHAPISLTVRRIVSILGYPLKTKSQFMKVWTLLFKVTCLMKATNTSVLSVTKKLTLSRELVLRRYPDISL
jgi:hypothetical protein